MCSVEPGEVTEMVVKSYSNFSDVCRKCGTPGSSIILRETDIYCNSCFMSYFVHKFRSTIGKSKQIKHKDKVLVGYSGGKNSTALLHLIRQGLDESSHKKLRFDPSFIFVDEQAVNHKSPSVDVCVNVTQLNFPCYHIELQELFSSNDKGLALLQYQHNKWNNPKSEANSNEYPTNEEFKNLISKSKSLSTHEDLVTQLRNELICRCAQQLGFKKIFLGENATNLSIRILSDIALGRGSQLSGHVHFRTTHFGVEVFRPMRELLENEIDFYLDIQNIIVPSIPGSDVSETDPSIVACTKNFILGLQKEFPTTVPTIFKTGDKLVAGSFDMCDTLSTITKSTDMSEASEETSTTMSEKEPLCIFCGFIRDTHHSSASALEAVSISKLMSTLQPPNTIFNHIKSVDTQFRSHNMVEHANEIISNNKMVQTNEEVNRYLCYGCQNIYEELNSVEYLPPRVREDYEVIKQKEAAIDIIKDCLL